MVTVNSPNSSIKVRPSRPNTRATITRRSYENHETKDDDDDLAACQLSPVASEQSSRMEKIAIENKLLQQALKEWELRYDEQMRDTAQQHNIIEHQLRSKNSNLEDYASRAKDRVAELESQLYRLQQALEGAESANLQLERRIGIMSEILTTTRVEPVALDSGRKQARPRPRSMLPPRAQSNRHSWIGSPERTPDFGAISSPSVSSKRDSTIEMFEPLERIVSREIWMSSPRQGDELDEPQSARSSAFSEQPLPETRARPQRRMRRFGGGSYGPKPLILPHTSQLEQNPFTAPPLDRHESATMLPFRRSVHLDSFNSPIAVRPRAVTASSDNALLLMNSSESTGPYDESDFDRVLILAHQSNDSGSYSFTSTDGEQQQGLASRNLMDELHALKVDVDPGADPRSEDDDDDQLSLGDDMESPFTLYSNSPHVLGGAPILVPHWQRADGDQNHSPLRREPFNPALEPMMGPFHRPDTEDTPRPPARRRLSESREDLSHLSALDRLRRTFGEIFNSPGDVARVVIHATQKHMHVPAALHNVQWWVVGLLWRPFAKRYQSQDDVSMAAPRSPSASLIENLAYGTIYTSPSSGIRRRAGMAGPGKKRTGNRDDEEDVVIRKHSPKVWLKFTVTLAYAVGLAFTKGPGTLMQGGCVCESCNKKEA